MNFECQPKKKIFLLKNGIAIDKDKISKWYQRIVPLTLDLQQAWDGFLQPVHDTFELLR